MPSKPRPGVKSVYVELPEGLFELLRQRAEQDRRKLKDTLILAIEQYLGVTPADYRSPAEAEEPRTKGKAAGQAGTKRKGKG
jgi:hypothetical protein